MALSAADHDPEVLTPSNAAQTMVYLADSLVELKDYGRAELYYRRALDLRKSLTKQRGMGSTVTAETGIYKCAWSFCCN
jgi:hypothetical protein